MDNLKKFMQTQNALKQGIYQCRKGHWLSDKFVWDDIEENIEIDTDWVWLAYEAAKIHAARGCIACEDVASMLAVSYGHQFPKLR